MTEKYDVVIIGGGIFGCMIALFLKNKNNRILVVEKSNDLVKKATYNNQARVHNGYHYPRSYLTALRSHDNYSLFKYDFKEAIFKNFEMKYAIASTFSKTTARQFMKFCNQVGSFVKVTSPETKMMFNNNLIENVFDVDEAIFDAGKMRAILKERLKKAGIPVKYNLSVLNVEENVNKVLVNFNNGNKILANQVYNCTYSGINKILLNSKLPLLPFKYELTEIPLFEAPESIKNTGITVMDGPFFGVLPFPDKKLHSMYHVRYSVHDSWDDERDLDEVLKNKGIANSNFLYMVKDAQRYMPILSKIKLKETLFEIRTVLQSKEANDGRPILFRKDFGIKGFNIVMGGKIDNVYDILRVIKS